MKKGDVLIILLCGLLCAFLFASSFTKRNDLKAVVWVDGEPETEVSLSEVEEEFSETFNGCTLSFSENGVKFVLSDCRDQLCVKHAVLSKNGDTMACVPNRVVVSIKSSKEKVDAVAY